MIMKLMREQIKNLNTKDSYKETVVNEVNGEDD